MTSNPYLKKQIVFPGFMDRIMAGLIDLFIVIYIFSPIMKMACLYLFKYKFGDFLAANDLPLNDIGDIDKIIRMEAFAPYRTLEDSLVFNSLLSSFQFVLVAIYFFSCWYYFDRTIGKFFLKMKIADFETLKKPTIKQYIIRYLSYLLYPIGIWWIFAGNNRRALHDRFSRTIIIKS